MGETITVRLDAGAQAALQQLVEAGATRSEAIRTALVGAAREHRLEALREEVRSVARDPGDRAEAQAILRFMEGLDDEG